MERLPNSDATRPRGPPDIYIAATVAYVVSDDADWITGSTIDVAGGMVF